MGIQEGFSKSEPEGAKKQPSINSSVVLVSFAALGTIAFIVVSSSLPFKQEQLETTFPKAQTQASSNISFIDSSGDQITQTISPTVVVQLASPWPQTQNKVSVSLSEDGVTFGSALPYADKPMITSYTFQNITPCDPGVQCKMVYVKFTSSGGLEQVYFRAIELKPFR